MRYQPEFDLDRRYGEEGETLVEGWRRGSVEVKHKTYLDFKLYVELEQNPRRSGIWKPSGLRVTTADYWDFVIGDTGVVVAIPTARLRLAVARGAGRPAETTHGDNPTRGRLIDLRELIA